MARAVLLALAFAELTSGTRYVDYSGVKMPVYGGGADYEGPRDEYGDRSSDLLSASQDYRDEDVEPIGRTEKLKEIEETEVWHEATVKYGRVPTSIDDGDIDTLDKYSPEEMVPKFKAGHRFNKHRSLKIRDFERDDVPRMRPLKTQTGRRVENKKEDFEDHSDDFRESKHRDLHVDQVQHARRTTTARIIRRKPRDRYEKPRSDDEDPLADLGLNLGGGREAFKADRFEDYRPREMEFRRNEGAPKRAGDSDSDIEFHRAMGSQRRPVNDPSLFSDKEDGLRKNMENRFHDYSDYYDMKRVQSIKNKLPSLMRKTTTEPPAVDQDMASRIGVPPFRRAGGDPMLAPVPNPALREMTTTTTPHTTIPMSSEETSPVSTVITVAISANPTSGNQNLSLAEKSKLSILKSLKKESGIGQTSTKPPVLLQVTNKAHTVIMVEPPTTPSPLQRARLVSNDSPGTIEKVKRLMRQKLIANSKNLHELTDNWDSMICDYVDTSLLKDDVHIPDYLSSGVNIDLRMHIVFIVMFFRSFL